MINVAIFCGGMSSEHEISIISANNIINALDRDKFNPIIILISRSGNWCLLDNPKKLNNIKYCEDRIGSMCSMIKDDSVSYLIDNNNKKTKIDCAFPVLHGPMGEDGTIQGMFEFLDLPYVGSGILASAISMNKEYFKKIMIVNNIPIVPYIIISQNNPYIKYESAINELSSEILFVKPVSMGSSIGVSKVRSQEEYDIAVKLAFEYSNRVMIEKYVQAREIECAILGNDNPIASLIGEIKPNHEFYSYEAKYIDKNGAELTIPAQLPEDAVAKIQDLALKIYKAVDCSGLARADFFVDEKHNIFINEINTLPGFTNISMYPKLWEFSGIECSKLIEKLIYFAFECCDKRRLLKRSRY